MSEIIGDCACPSCVEQGRDSTGNHLMLFEDGGGFCNRCGYSEGKDTYTKAKVTFGGSLTKEEVLEVVQTTFEGTAERALTDRDLKLHVCKHFGVRVTLSEVDGSTVTSRLYPVHPLPDTEFKYGDVQGYKVKSIGKEKRMFGKGRIKDGEMFGVQSLPRRGNKLFVTEGEDDAMALYQALYEHGDPKWRKNIAVVSLLNGAGGADKEIINNRAVTERFKEVVLCFDMDEAGQRAVDKVASVFPRDKLSVAKYELKDANDMIKAGLSKELYFSVLQSVEPSPEKIIKGSDITLEELLTPLKAGIQTIYPGLNAKLHGFRYGEGGGELSVFCSGSGMGKTTAAREIMYDFNGNHGLNLGHIFLEEQYRKTGQSYIALDNNVPLAAVRENPSILPPDKFTASYNRLIANGRTHFLKHFGSLASAKLMDYMWYLSKGAGCDFIMLDHISMVVSGQTGSSQGERKDLDILMTNLAAFCEDSGTSVIAIVHLRRPPDGSFNDGKKISLNHLRGSAAIEQLSHNIIAIEGDQQGDEPNARIFRVLKNREWGDLGEADSLVYNPDTGRLLPAVATIGGDY